MRGELLPVVPDPSADETLSHWVVRLAELNRMNIRQLFGQRKTERLDRSALPEELERLHALSGLPIDRLAAMTMAGRYPGIASNGQHVPPDDVRGPGEESCWDCEATGALSLRLMPMCTRCGRLLSDQTDYREENIDPRLTALQRRVEKHARGSNWHTLTDRVRRARGPVQHGWPPPPEHEPPERRRHALHLLAHEPETWSPPVVAMLLARTLGPTAKQHEHLWDRLDTGRWSASHDLDPEPVGDLYQESAKLDATIRRLGVQVRHIPLTINFSGSTPVLPMQLQRHHGAWAATLRRRTEQATGVATQLSRAADNHKRPWSLDDPWTLRLLTDTVQALYQEGLRDRDAAVLVLGSRMSVPVSVLRRLPPAARSFHNVSQLAAAWVALALSGAGTMAAGRPWIPNERVLMTKFHHALTAEGRLTLVEYGLQELKGWDDATVALARPLTARGREPWQSRVG